MRPSSQDTQPAVTPPSGGIFQSLLEGTSTPKSDAEDPLIGRTLGEYVVRRRLGVGGMGLVYEGEQPLIHRRVAIKVLKPELVQQPELLRPLLAEARAVSAVHHPGIIDIFGFGDLPGVGQYIVMEFLDGEPLDVAISRRAPFPAQDVLNILDQVLAALGAAHAAGVIHRDMKPSNVFLARDSAGATYVKLLDFGLAKHADVPHGLARQTRQSIMVGTPEYMSPEQAMGQTVGPMSDLYAVGVIAFEMLTGRLPFEGPNALSIAHSHVNDAPPRASTRAPVPAPLDDLVLQLLAKDPSERPQSAALVRERLKRMTPHLGLRVQPVPQLPMARDVRSLQTTLDGTSPTVRVRPSVDELPTLTMPTAELHARALRRSWVLPIAGAVALALGGTGLYVASRGTAPAPAEGRPLPGAAQAGAAGSARANSGESTTGVRAVPQAKDEGRALTASPPAATAGTAGSVVAGREVAPEKEPVRAVLPVESGSAPAGKGTRGDGTVKANGAPVQAPAASGGKPVESRTAAAARAVGLPSSPEPTAPAPRLVAPAPAQREPVRPVPEVRPAPAPAQGLPGKVRLLVKGWGNLTVDGTLLGQFPAPARFPLNAVELKPGTHVLELANGPAQKTWRSVVNVEPGGITELTVAW